MVTLMAKQKLCSASHQILLPPACNLAAYIYPFWLNTAETYSHTHSCRLLFYCSCCLFRQENKQRTESGVWKEESLVSERESITGEGEASKATMHEGYYVLSRRALLQAPLHSYGENAASSQVVAAGGREAPAAAEVAGSNSFDANVVMILAVLLCALICALGLNSIVRCALRCSTTRLSSPVAGTTQRAAAAGEQRRVAQMTGARRKALRAMPTLVYSAGLLPLEAGGGHAVCAICLAELEPGERVRVLPKCNHGFHVRCVDRWLLARSTCPTCRQPLFAAPPKGSGCAAGAEPAQVRAFLVPLRPESFVTPYDF